MNAATVGYATKVLATINTVKFVSATMNPA